MPTVMTESERNAIFRACPILKEYLATALQDLQFYEMDSSCEEGREERDTGTIYDCPDSTFHRAASDCAKFVEANREHIEAALELEPGEDGLRYGRHYFSYDLIGYYFYMERVGHGVGFTDNGDAPCLVAMEEYSRSHRKEGLYFGDDENVYWC